MFGLRNRDTLHTDTLDEFENLNAKLSAFLLTEHNEDGTHRSAATRNDGVPTGAMMDFAGSTAPTGWLIADGRQVSRVDYNGLFNVIGVTYGAGDGNLTFNLPDTRQRFRVGQAASGNAAVLGATGGAWDHTHTGTAHTHNITSVGAHTHVITAVADHSHTGPSHTHGAGSYTTPAHNHTGLTGVGDDEVERQPGGLAPYDTQTFDHRHSITTQAAAAITGTSGSGGTGSTSSDGGHNHGGATGSDGAHDHGGATASAGGGTTGANNPPWIALPCIIKD